jgi:D-hydroxyproline dehydrogenase subunit alpha
MAETGRDSFEVLVIGGGPAGIASATCAAEHGLETAIVDDNHWLAGQIWRRGALDERHGNWLERLRRAGVTVLCGTRVVQHLGAGVLLGETETNVRELRYSKLILATGARERFLPFPGWTLPNVMGVGALQAMVKSGLPIFGKRVVIAGTGPLLLAVAAYLRKRGADIRLVCEQASWKRLARFASGLLGQPTKAAQALGLGRDLTNVPFAANSWVEQAQGGAVLQSVEVCRGRTHETIACDYLACSFHFVPNLELPILLGCEVRNGYVHVDEMQQTSVSSIYCAGEPTGIGGVEMALVQGQIAGLAVAGQTTEAHRLFGARHRLRKFVSLMDRAFEPRHELRALASKETVVCRCEDVTYDSLHRQKSWREAKLLTRCGMGACQGRVCGPATAFLFGWVSESVRPPIFPARISTLAVRSSTVEAAEQTGGQ